MEPTQTDSPPTRRSLLTDTGSPLLPGLPRRPLNADQQMEALRKVQTQAEQRVKLGMQLFKSAESRLAAQSDMLERVRQEQKGLREQVQQDVAKSLQSYDQWMGQIDERFTTAMQLLEQKVDAMGQQWQTMRDEMAALMGRSEMLLDQSRCLVEQAQDRPHQTRPQTTPAPVQDMEPQPKSKKSTLPPIPAHTPEPSRPRPDATEDRPTHGDDQPIYSQILGQLREQSGDDLKNQN